MSLPKPKMRGLLEANIKRNIVGMTLCSIAGGIAWKIFVMDAKKQAYADFYKTFDAEKQLRNMNKAGVMDSCPQ